MKILKLFLNRFLKKSGYQLIKDPRRYTPADFREEFDKTYKKFKPYTHTSSERMFALHKAVQYLIDANIPGDFVECGVAQGGSMMVAANRLIELGDTSRNIYLYDTFEGLPKPTKKDTIQGSNNNLQKEWQKRTKGDLNTWFNHSVGEVKENMELTGYPEDKIFFIKGLVEDTIPTMMPEKISLLRLDMDLYEPTKHALSYLFSSISQHGVLLLDNYGVWEGEKKAVDEFLKENNISILLNRVDKAGCIGVKI